MDTGTIEGTEGTIGEAKGVNKLLEETALEDDIGGREGEVQHETTLGHAREASEASEGIILETGIDVGAEEAREGAVIESRF